MKVFLTTYSFIINSSDADLLKDCKISTLSRKYQLSIIYKHSSIDLIFGGWMRVLTVIIVHTNDDCEKYSFL